jgi:cytochrome c oxidase subunit 4
VEETAATATEEAPAELEAAPGHAGLGVHDEHAHPTPLKYVGIAAILATVTGIEVGLYYINLPDKLFVALLLGLAFIKFSMVAAYFMHLKFDGRLLRRLFVTGIILAATVYTVALLTLNVLLG